MMDALTYLRIAATCAGVLPLVACGLAFALARFRHRSPPSPEVVRLAAVLAISFAADLYAENLRAQGLPNIWVTYVYVPVQYGLLALLVFRAAVSMRVVTVGFALVAAVSLLTSDYVRPEVTIQVLGGAWVGVVAWKHPELGRYRMPVVLYCVIAIPFLLALGAMVPALTWQWLSAWVGYQVVRIAALAWLGLVMLSTPHLRLEVVRDERGRGGTGHRESGWRIRRRGGDGSAGLSHLPVFEVREAGRRRAG